MTVFNIYNNSAY